MSAESMRANSGEVLLLASRRILDLLAVSCADKELVKSISKINENTMLGLIDTMCEQENIKDVYDFSQKKHKLEDKLQMLFPDVQLAQTTKNSIAALVAIILKHSA